MDMSGFLEDEKLRYVWNIKGVTIGITGLKKRQLFQIRVHPIIIGQFLIDIQFYRPCQYLLGIDKVSGVNKGFGISIRTRLSILACLNIFLI